MRENLSKFTFFGLLIAKHKLVCHSTQSPNRAQLSPNNRKLSTAKLRTLADVDPAISFDRITIKFRAFMLVHNDHHEHDHNVARATSDLTKNYGQTNTGRHGRRVVVAPTAEDSSNTTMHGWGRCLRKVLTIETTLIAVYARRTGDDDKGKHRK